MIRVPWEFKSLVSPYQPVSKEAAYNKLNKQITTII